MWLYKDITFSGFRSYKNEQTLKLDLNPGLYYFTGKNFVDEVGSNGVGKSSFLDAISWVEYGKTIRGVKGANVINWKSKTAKVSINLEKNNSLHNITRTHTPNSLKLDGKDIEQSELDKFLPINHDQFLYAQVVGQFNESFLDLSPTDRLNLFSNIMKLQLYEQAAKKASELAKSVELKISKLNGALEQYKKSVENSKIRIQELESSNSSFEQERTNKLNSLKISLDEQLNESQTLESKIKDFEKLVDYYNSQKSNESNDTSELNKLAKELNDSLIENKTSIKVIESEINNFTKDLNKWKEIGNECLYCKQTISEDLVKNNKTNLTKNIIERKKLINELTTKNTEYSEKIKTVQNNITKITSTIREIDSQINTTQQQIRTTENKLSSSQTQIKSLRKSISDEESRVNPYIALIAKENQTLTELEKDIENNKKELSTLGTDYAAYDFWSSSFKEVRLWIVSEALQALEYESNDILSKLGLSSMRLTFQMEKETTTGNINKGFHIFITSPDSKGKSIPIEVWSGGELQRLKLATTLGLMSLIQSYSGLDSNLLILDEPTHHLSQQGIDYLLEFLDEYATIKQKVIFLIDHNNIESSHFKQIFTVIKDDNGSRIE